MPVVALIVKVKKRLFVTAVAASASMTFAPPNPLAAPVPVVEIPVPRVRPPTVTFVPVTDAANGEAP